MEGFLMGIIKIFTTTTSETAGNWNQLQSYEQSFWGNQTLTGSGGALTQEMLQKAMQQQQQQYQLPYGQEGYWQGLLQQQQQGYQQGLEQYLGGKGPTSYKLGEKYVSKNIFDEAVSFGEELLNEIPPELEGDIQVTPAQYIFIEAYFTDLELNTPRIGEQKWGFTAFSWRGHRIVKVM